MAFGFGTQLMAVYFEIGATLICFIVVIYTGFSFVVICDMKRCTSPRAELCFVGVDIESKKLSILKILLVFCVESRTEKVESAVVKIVAALSFVDDWVKKKLCLIVAEHGLINLRFVKASFLQQVHGGVICEGVLLVRVAPSITPVMIRACVKIMLILQFAWICFENSQMLPYTFDVGLCQ
jgi:hypothetical protein